MTYGLIAFLVGIIASRFLAEKGYATLTGDEKTRLMDGFSQHRKYSLIPLAVIVILYMGAMQVVPHSHRELTWALLAGTVLYLVATTVWMQRRLRALDLPPAYVRTFLLARAISFVGVLVLFGALQWGGAS